MGKRSTMVCCHPFFPQAVQNVPIALFCTHRWQNTRPQPWQCLRLSIWERNSRRHLSLWHSAAFNKGCQAKLICLCLLSWRIRKDHFQPESPLYRIFHGEGQGQRFPVQFWVHKYVGQIFSRLDSRIKTVVKCCPNREWRSFQFEIQKKRVILLNKMAKLQCF